MNAKQSPPDSNAVDLADMLSALCVGDGNNAEQTCGAFATALDAAKAHDAEALRVYGPAAEAMMNFPMTNYPNVSTLCTSLSPFPPPLPFSLDPSLCTSLLNTSRFPCSAALITCLLEYNAALPAWTAFLGNLQMLVIQRDCRFCSLASFLSDLSAACA